MIGNISIDWTTTNTKELSCYY